MNSEQLAHAYRDVGLSMAQCAQAFGISVATVHKALHRAGVPIRDRGVGRRGKGAARYVGGHGYVVVYDPSRAGDGWPLILEHRLVMERLLRRRLRKDETVHHINGIKTDNRPENLRLYGSNGDHIRSHATPGRWRRHKQCVACGTAERPHMARGMCDRCYNRWLRNRE